MESNEVHNLDPIIHERIRLGILSILLQEEETDFVSLKKELNTTDGNLSRHLSVLEENNIIVVRKTFVGKKPRTYYKLTKEGRKRFISYLETLEGIIKNTLKGGK